MTKNKIITLGAAALLLSLASYAHAEQNVAEVQTAQFNSTSEALDKVSGFFSNIGSALKSGIQHVGSSTGNALESAGQGLQRLSSSDKEEPTNERVITPTTSQQVYGSNERVVQSNDVTQPQLASVVQTQNTQFQPVKTVNGTELANKASDMIQKLRNNVTNTNTTDNTQKISSDKNDRFKNTLF